MDMKKVEELAFRVVGDMGGAFTMALGYIGDRLGLFKAMSGAGPLSSAKLAEKTELNERYVREWLKAMVASHYIDHDDSTDTYSMTDEQAFVLTNEESPLFVGGAFHFATPTVVNAPKFIDIFRNGGGIKYSEIGEEVPEAIERFFRPGYLNFLTQEWLPKVAGLTEKLQAGGRVADVGCGCGQSTVTMAKAYPKATIVGIDNDEASIKRATKLAADQGVKNVEWVTASASELPGKGPFDLACAFDCVHDMTDPVGVLRAVRDSLAPEGVLFWSEPNASANPTENRNPVGKVFAGVSPLHCMTVSLAHGGAGLGTILGEEGARRLGEEAGFKSFEKLAIENPFNQFFALRP